MKVPPNYTQCTQEKKMAAINAKIDLPSVATSNKASNMVSSVSFCGGVKESPSELSDPLVLDLKISDSAGIQKLQEVMSGSLSLQDFIDTCFFALYEVDSGQLKIQKCAIDVEQEIVKFQA